MGRNLLTYNNYLMHVRLPLEKDTPLFVGMEAEKNMDEVATANKNHRNQRDSNSNRDQKSKHDSRHLSSPIKNEIQEMFGKQMKVMSALMVLLSAVVIAVSGSSLSSINACPTENSHVSGDTYALHEELPKLQAELQALRNELKSQQKTIQPDIDNLLATINNTQHTFSTAYTEIQTNFTSTASELSKHFWMMANLRELHRNHTADFADFQDDVRVEFEQIRDTDSLTITSLHALSAALERQSKALEALSNDTSLILKHTPLAFGSSSNPITSYSAALTKIWSKASERNLVSTPVSIRVVNDQLWVSCEEDGLAIHSPDFGLDLLKVVSLSGLGINIIMDVAQLSDGDVIIAAGDGLFHFDSQSKFLCVDK